MPPAFPQLADFQQAPATSAPPTGTSPLRPDPANSLAGDRYEGQLSPPLEAGQPGMLRVDLGAMGERQIVAGIRQWYGGEELEGKTVAVVANLEPATLRGVESQGIVLAVLDGDDVSVLTTDREVGPGRQIL